MYRFCMMHKKSYISKLILRRLNHVMKHMLNNFAISIVAYIQNNGFRELRKYVGTHEVLGAISNQLI